MDWSRFYFWELFSLDVLTIVGCLGVLASIPIGAVIGKRLRVVIKGKKVNNNPANRQANPNYEECPLSPIKHTPYQGSQRKTNEHTTYDIPKPFNCLFVAHYKRIILRVKRIVQPNANKTFLNGH